MSAADLPAARQTDAVEALDQAVRRYVHWVQSVRPADGARGRFRWARESSRPANVASTAYIMGALKTIGLFDPVVTAEDRAAGAAWVQAMHLGDQQYRDPAFASAPPGWTPEQPWPPASIQEGVNQYARNALGACIGGKDQLPQQNPPAGWPQPTDAPADMLEWLRTRPWGQNVWGAGSHAMRVARYMLRWHREGRLQVEAVHQAFRLIYSLQDPQTGLWGTPNQAANVRINGTFKLFHLIRDQIDLPLRHGDRLIDYVLAELRRPGYEETAGGCDELDNWYVIALAAETVPGYRAEEIRALALHRILRILARHQKPDGGFSFQAEHCATHWNAVDMAPPLPQGDAIALNVLGKAISICIDLAGIGDQTPWDSAWRRAPDATDRAIVLPGLYP